MSEKTPRHPAEARIEFWQNETRIAREALEASQRENTRLERHYRAALEALNAAGIAPPTPSPNTRSRGFPRHRRSLPQMLERLLCRLLGHPLRLRWVDKPDGLACRCGARTAPTPYGDARLPYL